MIFTLLQASNNIWRDPITWATIIIAVATIVSVWVSIRMLGSMKDSAKIARESAEIARDNTKITRDIFEAAHRPYIGITDLERKVNEQNLTLRVIAKVGNFGSVPANEIDVRIIVLEGERLIPMNFDGGIVSIAPHSETFTTVEINAPNLRVIETNPLTLHYSITYKGIGEKTYEYDYKAVWQPNRRAFATPHIKST